MADNVTIPAQGTGDTTPKVAADEATYSGDTVKIQLVRPVHVFGSEGSKTIVDLTVQDNTGFTDGTTGLGMAGYIFDESAGTALTENDAAAARLDSKRAQVFTLEDESTRGQRLKIDANKRAAVTDGIAIRSTATPTIATAGYVTGDAYGGVMTFATMALANGGQGRIVNAVITNRDTDSPVLELWLFRVTPTSPPTDSSTFDYTDANLESAELVGIIDFLSWYNTAAGQVCIGQMRGFGMGGNPLYYVCASADTALYGQMCIRSTATQGGSTDVIVSLTTIRD